MINELTQFIPCPSGQANMLRPQLLLINSLSNKVVYEPSDGYVVFMEDIISTKNITHVDMKIAVMDMLRYGDFDELPLPADLVAKIIMDCASIFSNQAPQNEKGESVAENITK
jgi:hypothetical protein